MKAYSVLMSLYSREKAEFLRHSIDSMLGQTIRPEEIVIVLDGPLPEDLMVVVREYRDREPELFTIVVSPVNVGLGNALNLGLKACRNEIVARMDTDDISRPDRCEKQLLAFEQDEALAIVGTNVDEFADDPAVVLSTRAVPEHHEDIYLYSRRRSAFNHPTVMYRKDRVLSCGGYSGLRRNQDVDLFGRMLYCGCRARNLQEPLLLFRCNRDLMKRRRSWENTRTYIGTVCRFWRMGFSSILDVAVVTAAQLVLFLSPLAVQNWIYAHFLRKPAAEGERRHVQA